MYLGSTGNFSSQQTVIVLGQQYGTSLYFREQLLDHPKNSNHSYLKNCSLFLDKDLVKYKSDSKSLVNKIKHIEKIDKARQRDVKKRNKEYRSYINLKNKFRFIEYVSSEKSIYFYEY